MEKVEKCKVTASELTHLQKTCSEAKLLRSSGAQPLSGFYRYQVVLSGIV